MKRTVLKWWISRAVDQKQDISPWLRSRIDRDPELRDFEHAARELETRLREDSIAWIETGIASVNRARPEHINPGPSLSRAHAFLPLTAAALLLIGATAVWNFTRQNDRNVTTATNSIDLSPRTVGSPSDVKVIAKFLDVSRALMQPIATAVPRHLPTSSVPGEHLLREYGVSLTQPTNEVLRGVKSKMSDQRQQMSSEVRSVVGFFAKRLPRSAAQLLGLQEIADGVFH